MSPVESILKKTVIVLSIILALMLIYLTARSFYRSRSTALAESAAAVPEAAPIPESEPEPESVPVSRGAPLILLDDAEISSEIRRIAEEHEAVGIQVSIINDGEVIASFADGWATIDDDPMTVDHKIRIASVSKVIVGMTAMLLQEDGVIDIDADIGEYWDVEARNPAYPDIPITIRSILNHTSTISTYEYGFSSAASIRNRLTYSYISAEPGSIDSWCYNNYAFQVLGATLEVAADQTVDDILRDKLFRPMDIDASFAGGDLQNTDLLATLYRGYTVEQSVGTQESFHLDETPGENSIYYAGGLTISAEDLAKLVALLANDGIYQHRQLMQRESVALMETYNRQPLEDDTYQALPLLFVPELYGRGGIYFHSGAAYGIYSCISLDPETGDGVVVLTTGADGGADRYGIYNICDAINEYIYKVIR